MSKQAKKSKTLYNCHVFPLESEGKVFKPGAPVKGINRKTIESWRRRGVLSEEKPPNAR